MLHPRRRLGLLSVCLLLTGLMAAPASAQFDTASVVGTVKDNTGAVVPGATVTLSNLDTGIAATRVSDENGNFEFMTVRIGRYKVTAELQGFSTALADNIPVAVGARQRVDLQLKAGNITETVEVVGAATRLDTDSSQRGQIITSEQAVQLPLNGREYSSLALLSPGVRLSSLNTGSSSTVREGSFNINGLRSTFNNFLLDGIDNNAYGTSNQGFSNQVMQPSPDAVAEFKVVTNNMSAEYGRSAGGDDQRRLPERHQQVERRGVGVLPRHQAERRRLLQAGLGREAAAQPQPVRRHVRRPDRQEPRLLLRRLRGLPADPQGGRLRDDSDRPAAAGSARRRRPQPAHRRHLSGRHAAADDRLCANGARRAARPDDRRGVEQLFASSSSSPTTTTKATSRRISRSARR